MAFGQSTSARPIAGAVATMGVSDRVAFLRKTYSLLGVALIAFAAITAGMMPKYARSGPTSSTVRTGCETRPAENPDRAPDMA